MELNPDACYEALKTHDRRFDGVFFVGVTSTGIYCRPVCPARTPRRENCRFFTGRAQAEKAGFRPCLRCRPELAPGNAAVDAENRLATLAFSHIEDGALAEGGVEALAAGMGITERHLRRVVQHAFGVSPIALAQTQRLSLARRLLTDTDLPITEVAFASGFQSLRRFNALFQQRYHLNPTALRQQRAAEPFPASLTCDLAYVPPLDWQSLLSFLGGRALCGCETVAADVYRRTLRYRDRVGWLSVGIVPDRAALQVTVSVSLAPVLTQVLALVKRVFDVHADTERIEAHLGTLAAHHPGLRIPGAFDGFEMAVRAILGQQVSVRAATTLSTRFVRTFGEPVETPFAELSCLSPTPARVAALTVDEIAGLGIFAGRARTLIALAQAVDAGEVRLQPTTDVEQVIARLQQIPGIGAWTAHYIALRAFGWPDAFPSADYGILKAMGETDPGQALARAEAWRPWRGYAVMHLWKSLESTAQEKQS